MATILRLPCFALTTAKLHLVIASILWALGTFSKSETYHGFPSLLSRQELVVAELGPHLSPNASIILPGSVNFINAITRWQEYNDPNITVVVKVAIESDVQQTVLYANQHNLPFLTVGGAHGAINSLGNVHNGIQIWTRSMNSVEIAEDGQTATIGGGAISKEVVDALWAANKQTTTGACECTGIGGPLLGGGHGWLEGRHGLVADNLVEARMILANGTAVTVSNTSHSNLFWAIRGAGHNFGVVTQFKQQIYDVAPDATWAYEQFIFSGDKIEELYEQVNIMQNEGTPPVELINYSLLLRIPQYDPVHPVILFFILYEGTLAEEQQYGAPYHSMNPLSVDSGTSDLPGLAPLTVNAMDQEPCQHGTSALRFPISLVKYNTTAQRAVYNFFSNFSAQPEFNTSFFLFEGYSVKGVKDVSHASTAFPNRDDNLLISSVIVYEPSAALDGPANKAGAEMREILRAGSGSSEVHVYVNYAHGDEDLQEMYGYEPWRLERLRALKAEYDPLGRFNFYAPIN